MAQETQTGALYQLRRLGWEGRWEGGSKGREYVYLRMIHVEVGQKTTNICKTIILQLKINKFKKTPITVKFTGSAVCQI